MIYSALVSILVSAVVVGIFGALKYYSNSVDPTNPESFEIKKFAPILVISILISLGMAYYYGDITTPELLSDFLSKNFLLVMFVNTGWTILLKKFPSFGDYFLP